MINAPLRTGARAVLVITVLALVVVTLNLHSFLPQSAEGRWTQTQNASSIAGDNVETFFDNDTPPCASLENTDGIVVVMRTGATEIQAKLPAHLNTTFKCYQDPLIFSDLEEDFCGYEVHDVLATIDSEIQRKSPDFALWRRLKTNGRAALQQNELSSSEGIEGSKIGKTDNAGWRLDKWKFLPMLQQCLDLRPDGKVYVFVEPDTYVLWSNLIQWLQHIDLSKPLYFGSEVEIGSDVFAHGGSAFVLTRAAVQKGADEYATNTQTWNERIVDHWAGDGILGQALHEAGVPLTWAWPMFQGGNPGNMDWEKHKGSTHLWCASALSYHHIDAEQIPSLWAFEQRGIATSLRNKKSSLFSLFDTGDVAMQHGDLFHEFVLPFMESDRADWDNLSRNLQKNVASAEGCLALCEADRDCFQYSFSPTGCKIDTAVALGEAEQGVQSGWIMERVEAWAKELSRCKASHGLGLTYQ